MAWSPQTDSILTRHHPGTIGASSIGHSSLSRTKGDGAHLTKTQTRTVLKEQTEGALSKALSVAGLMGPGHRLPTCSLD